MKSVLIWEVLNEIVLILLNVTIDVYIHEHSAYFPINTITTPTKLTFRGPSTLSLYYNRIPHSTYSLLPIGPDHTRSRPDQSRTASMPVLTATDWSCNRNCNVTSLMTCDTLSDIFGTSITILTIMLYTFLNLSWL